jgi:hypothetical protein
VSDRLAICVDGRWLLPLTQGKFSTLDPEDAAWAEQWLWRTLTADKTHYASRRVLVGGKYKELRLHREIALRMGLQIDPEIDHIDGNGLNNVRANLRPASQLQNRRNKSLYRNNKKRS